MALENGISPERRIQVARVLEDNLEKICDAYEERLQEMESPLLTRPETRRQLRDQARRVLEDCVRRLGGAIYPGNEAGDREEDRLPMDIGVARAREGVHAVESLRAVVALSGATLGAVTEHLPPSPTSRSEVAEVALILQGIIMEDLMQAAVSYGDFLLRKVHESHADERRRISRELHDRVAHTIMVVFRSLELYGIYREDDPGRARQKLDLAAEMAQEALKLIRDLSRDLRNSSAGEGLEALSDLLCIGAPAEVRSWVSVEGDESLVLPGIRDELFLLLREAVRNAGTHSGAAEIGVKVRITEGRIEASVEDDGRGFEKEVVGTGSGLASMRERAALLGGTLDLRSAPGKGTVVEVTVPLPQVSR